MDAMRSVLIQNLVLTWRYSVGNPYQELATADGITAAGVIETYGFTDVNREILRTSFRKHPTPFPNWKMGAKLAGTGLYYRLIRDRSPFVTEATPVLSGYLETLRRQIARTTGGLLRAERFSQDVAKHVIGLHAQAVVWQGLRLMGAAWADTGHAALAATCRRLSARLGSALLRAIHASERQPDGSLFIPVRLLDDEFHATHQRLSCRELLEPRHAVRASVQDCSPPAARKTSGVARYLLLHGSRLLGLVRAGAYALYGDAPVPTSGTDQVYGLNMARFLADDDQPTSSC